MASPHRKPASHRGVPDASSDERGSVAFELPRASPFWALVDVPSLSKIRGIHQLTDSVNNPEKWCFHGGTDDRRAAPGPVAHRGSAQLHPGRPSSMRAWRSS